MIKLYFEPEPFYSDKMEDKLPKKDLLIKYVTQQFRPYFMALQKRVDVAYKIRQQNALNYFSGKRIKRTVDVDNYNELHSEYNRLNDYYGLLLTAAKRKYGIWLNDFK